MANNNMEIDDDDAPQDGATTVDLLYSFMHPSSLSSLVSK